MVVYDSRWQFPELLGYKPEDPQYDMLKELYRRVTNGKAGSEES
jgi:hypothetical protein